MPYFVADIDECQTGSVCAPLERCVNIPGRYRCENETEAACKLGQEKLDGRCIGKWHVLEASVAERFRALVL